MSVECANDTGSIFAFFCFPHGDRDGDQCLESEGDEKTTPLSVLENWNELVRSVWIRLLGSNRIPILIVSLFDADNFKAGHLL